jgi:hypothetical protein
LGVARGNHGLQHSKILPNPIASDKRKVLAPKRYGAQSTFGRVMVTAQLCVIQVYQKRRLAFQA